MLGLPLGMAAGPGRGIGSQWHFSLGAPKVHVFRSATALCACGERGAGVPKDDQRWRCLSGRLIGLSPDQLKSRVQLSPDHLCSAQLSQVGPDPSPGAPRGLGERTFCYHTSVA
jgi:hypothetical protein